MPLIICASSGIGFATSKKIAKSGFNMVLHYNSNKRKIIYLISILKKDKLAGLEFKADLNKDDEIQILIYVVINRFGKIDLLVNCVTPKDSKYFIRELKLYGMWEAPEFKY